MSRDSKDSIINTGNSGPLVGRSGISISMPNEDQELIVSFPDGKLREFNHRDFESQSSNVVNRIGEDRDGLLMSLLKLGATIMVSPIILSATIYTGVTSAVLDFADMLGKHVAIKKFGADKEYTNPITRFLSQQGDKLFKETRGLLIGPVKNVVSNIYEISRDAANGGLTILQRNDFPSLRKPSGSPQNPYASFLGPQPDPSKSR